MTCTQRLDTTALVDYWLGVLTPGEEEPIEEHIFSCDECSLRLAEIHALAEATRVLAQEGALLMVVSESFLKRMADQGRRIRRYTPPSGGNVQCTVAAEDDLLIGSLAADLSTAKRIDLSLCDLKGKEQFRLVDIPFDPHAKTVLWQQSITFAKAAPTSTMVARLFNVETSGSETLLGEYTFNHTRTLPGPGAW